MAIFVELLGNDPDMMKMGFFLEIFLKQTVAETIGPIVLIVI